jgi:hypothetical protein
MSRQSIPFFLRIANGSSFDFERFTRESVFSGSNTDDKMMGRDVAILGGVCERRDFVLCVRQGSVRALPLLF